MSGSGEQSFLSQVGIAVVYLVALVVLAGLFLWLIDKVFRRRPSKEQAEAYSKAFMQRLLNPDFAAFEAHYGCVVPEALKALYADKNEIERGDFDVVTKGEHGEETLWFVAFYEPADGTAVRDGWPGCESLFAFANDGCGNEYLVDPKNPDLQVRFHDHETSEFTEVGLSLVEFMRAPRRAPKD